MNSYSLQLSAQRSGEEKKKHHGVCRPEKVYTDPGPEYFGGVGPESFGGVASNQSLGFEGPGKGCLECLCTLKMIYDLYKHR